MSRMGSGLVSMMIQEEASVNVSRESGYPGSRVVCLPGVRHKDQVDVGLDLPELVLDTVGSWTEIMSMVEDPGMLMSHSGLVCMSAVEEAYTPVGGVVSRVSGHSQISGLWLTSPARAWLETARKVVHVDGDGLSQGMAHNEVRAVGDEQEVGGQTQHEHHGLPGWCRGAGQGEGVVQEVDSHAQYGHQGEQCPRRVLGIDVELVVLWDVPGQHDQGMDHHHRGLVVPGVAGDQGGELGSLHSQT